MAEIDPALEKWVEEHEFDTYDSARTRCLGSAVKSSDLRALLKGKRLVEDVPTGWIFHACGAHGYKHGPTKPDERTGWQPLYAAPSDDTRNTKS